MHNSATSTIDDLGEGGGIMCFYNLVMTDNQVSWNEAKGEISGQGGGVYISGDQGSSSMIVKNNTITHNKAVSGSDMTEFAIGGGLLIWKSSGTVTGNICSFNETEVSDSEWSYGAGVFIQEVTDNDIVFENNLIQGNAYTGGNCNGGGLSLWMTGGTYQNNVVQNNTGFNGGGIYIGNGAPDTAFLINNTVTGNGAESGGGLYLSASGAVVLNSILWGNAAPVGASIYEESGTLEVRYSDVQGDAVWPGEGNINTEPQFLADGYHLDPYSALVNAGISGIQLGGSWHSCPGYDIDGDVRPYANTQPDIGADEVPFAVSTESMSPGNTPFGIYPNPASREITVEASGMKGKAHVEIFCVSGEKVMEMELQEAITRIGISTLPRGVYFVRVQDEKVVKVTKLVKQ
jgi:hypothetical protein